MSGAAALTSPVSFSTLFSADIINALCCSKVKMPIVDLHNGTTDLKNHLGVVYKAQMYVQDVDDIAYYRYFPAALEGIAQSWFNGLNPKSVSCFQDLVDRLISQFITSHKERGASIHRPKIKQGPQESLTDFIKRFH